ncbi:hypothetical protein [Xanthomonas sp. WHRI 6106]|uniref:hypothetical protein n=1 Tax=Xanthomonas TaxID=338 RepID=UPI0032E8D4C4
MDTPTVRDVGEYLLTAHVCPLHGKFVPELLVSRPGGITLRRHCLPGAAFADRDTAYDYARQSMSLCQVSSTGLVTLSNVSLA